MEASRAATGMLDVLATKEVRFMMDSDLPKTRSGKIMRRLLRSIAEGQELGNTMTLADPSVVDEIQKQFKKG